MIGKWLLCDFHIHTSMSDGKMDLADIIDLYGREHFDVIGITDHFFDSATRERGPRWAEKSSVLEENFNDYLNSIWLHAELAWQKYKMLVIPGMELTNDTDGYHILGLDVKRYVDPSLPVEDIIEQLHNQRAIAVACHPHHDGSTGDKRHENKTFLWQHHEKFDQLFDVWEVANRDDLFNVVGLKKLNYIANSDFHKANHLYSWKTLLLSDKNPEAIKQALKDNNNVAIYLYRSEKVLYNGIS